MSLLSHLKKTAVAGAIAALSTSFAFGAEMTLKLGHLANEKNAWHLAAVKFGDELKARTDGRIEVQVFPNESLGKEIDLINGMQLGTVDMTITGESLQNWAPKAALLASGNVFPPISSKINAPTKGPINTASGPKGEVRTIPNINPTVLP